MQPKGIAEGMRRNSNRSIRGNRDGEVLGRGIGAARLVGSGLVEEVR